MRVEAQAGRAVGQEDVERQHPRPGGRVIGRQEDRLLNVALITGGMEDGRKLDLLAGRDLTLGQGHCQTGTSPANGVNLDWLIAHVLELERERVVAEVLGLAAELLLGRGDLELRSGGGGGQPRE